MGELTASLRSAVEPLLEPGEELLGTCVATEQTLFRGHATAIGVTEWRLLLQPLDRRFQPKGDPLLLRPADIAAASAGGAGGSWTGISQMIMDEAAVTLKLRTTGGRQVKLMMMRGGGLLGRLGGEEQAEGVRALGDWFRRTG